MRRRRRERGEEGGRGEGKEGEGLGRGGREKVVGDVREGGEGREEGR